MIIAVILHIWVNFNALKKYFHKKQILMVILAFALSLTVVLTLLQILTKSFFWRFAQSNLNDILKLLHTDQRAFFHILLPTIISFLRPI